MNKITMPPITKIVLRAAAFAALVVLPVLAGAEAKLWHQGKFADALTVAAQERRPLAIDFYAVWCGPCKEMDKKTYTDKKVVALARDKFVMVRLDAERGEGIDLAKKYQVGSYPTVVFLSPDAKELDRFTGYLGPVEFAAAMRDALDGKTKIDKLIARLDVTPRDGDLLLEIADQYALVIDTANAEKYASLVLDLDPKNQKGFASRAYQVRADVARRQKDYPRAAAILEEGLQKFPGLKEERDYHRSLGVYYARGGDAAKSLAAFQTQIQKWPDSASYNAMAWESSQRKINLKEAEEAAKKAVALAKKKSGKDDPGVLDTLAEVYFAQGRFDEAIALAKREIKLDPKDEYFKLQLAKYEAAKPKS